VTDHYNQPELAVVYDDDNGWDVSDEFYRDLATRLRIRSLLDLGCGTGALTRGIVQAVGCSAVGIDPAEPMLEIARRNARSDPVEWLLGDARAIDLERSFDLIIMTGHAFQGLLTEPDQIALFERIAEHLAPDGRFALDSRNPAAREWLEWTPDLSRRTVETKAYGAVEIWNEAAMGEDEVVDVVEHYRVIADDRRLRSDFRLRFSAPEEIWEAMMAAGLAVEHCFGDWDRSLFTPEAREIIVVGRSAEW